jgi:hypothetical protein
MQEGKGNGALCREPDWISAGDILSYSVTKRHHAGAFSVRLEADHLGLDSMRVRSLPTTRVSRVSACIDNAER